MKMIMIAMQNSPFLTALIDEQDLERVMSHGWFAEKRKYTYYASTGFRLNGKTIHVRLHRFILGITDRKVLIDHVDRNGLNCTRQNLRIVTRAQNTINVERQNQCLGIRHRYGNYQAYIVHDRKYIHLGSFRSKFDAIAARNQAVMHYQKEFAVLSHG